MASKKTTERIREEVRADQARYDEVTRQLKERIERGTGKGKPSGTAEPQDEARRDSS
jgi:hypothetical protein